jgi:hypothetical protein
MLLLIAELLIAVFLWVSFRSQLRGSGGFAPPSLASLRYVC